MDCIVEQAAGGVKPLSSLQVEVFMPVIYRLHE